MNETWDETRDETILLMHDICGLAIESLAIITVNNPDVVRVLIDILQTFHADEDLSGVIMTLGEYGSGKPDVIDALADFVQNTSSPILCEIAMRSLGQVGAANQKAIDTLRNWAQNSQDEEIRQMAAECLISISDGHP
ncbi:MAG: HEAT repeat domain-containing protein [Hormoscilla sp. SP5CHS1]|nr:HEAT repeat domain-containing protein [Hormoscilla sp. SP12CHS1]MBC6454155.1 HEAT repeat domain-containing protein [Hormoscilla sp. SP5CHS1]